MYAYIKGIVEELDIDRLVIENNGIGYNVYVAPSTLAGIGFKGKEIKLYTYLSIKEDAHTLFGFLSKEELNLFKLLIGVNGIGPKAGLSILGTLGADNLRFAIMSGDDKAISKSPGIGSKTAQKVILELKDKIKLEDIPLTNEDGVFSTATNSINDNKEISNEAALALTALGYTQTEALQAIRKCKSSECNTVEDLIKQALKYMIS